MPCFFGVLERPSHTEMLPVFTLLYQVICESLYIMCNAAKEKLSQYEINWKIFLVSEVNKTEIKIPNSFWNI